MIHVFCGGSPFAESLLASQGIENEFNSYKLHDWCIALIGQYHRVIACHFNLKNIVREFLVYLSSGLMSNLCK